MCAGPLVCVLVLEMVLVLHGACACKLRGSGRDKWRLWLKDGAAAAGVRVAVWLAGRMHLAAHCKSVGRADVAFTCCASTVAQGWSPLAAAHDCCLFAPRSMPLPQRLPTAHATTPTQPLSCKQPPRMCMAPVRAVEHRWQKQWGGVRRSATGARAAPPSAATAEAAGAATMSARCVCVCAYSL